VAHAHLSGSRVHSIVREAGIEQLVVVTRLGAWGMLSGVHIDLLQLCPGFVCGMVQCDELFIACFKQRTWR
jgi:hypothetical protein